MKELPNLPTPPAEADETRQRIVSAAEEVFAQIGFEAATVRGICERAGVKNIGAVNYYFQGKENLYTEVVRDALDCCSEGLPFPEWSAETSPVQKLRDFIRVLMSRFLRSPRIPAMQLMMREFAQPSPACQEAVLKHIKPIANRLHDILAELLPETAQDKRWLIGFSIVGQCVYYRQNRAVAEILVSKEAIDRLDVDFLAEHIASFSLAALGFADPTLNRR
ncbi:MAG: CerR family C-terminal domain-containing protein [Planctomycetes bacterium]|nr:CerR family C-terminal domain-containing protein [Planctomycetota bacterium]